MEEVARSGTVNNNPVAVVELIDVKVFFLQVLEHGRKWPEANSSCEHSAWGKSRQPRAEDRLTGDKRLTEDSEEQAPQVP